MATVPKSISADIEIVFPDEIWIRIISYVPMAQWPSLESINKTIQQNVYESWKKVKIIKFDEDLSIDRRKVWANAFDVKKSIFKKLLLRAPNIRSMNGFTIFTQTTQIPFPDGEFLQKLTEFAYLESLDFTNILITYIELANFLKTPTIRSRLKTLKLLNSIPIFDATAWQNENPVLARTFGDIPDLPPLRLERFEFGGLSRCFDFFETIDVTNLSVLKLTEARCEVGHVGLLIGRCSINLRHLECSLFGKSDYRILFTAIATCKNLSILKISGRNYIPITNIVHSDVANRIGQLCPFGNLREFLLLIPQLVNDEVIKAIAHCLPDLISLELNVDQGSPFMVTYLISKLHRLKKLGLYTIPDTDQQIINRDVVKMLAKTLIDLEYLHLTNPPIYSNMESDLDRLEKLNGLSLECGSKTKNHHLLVWIMNFGLKLESLTLKGFQDDEFQGILLSLSKKTPNLRRLGLKNCKIGDDYLLQMVGRCPYLEEFDLSLCRHVTVYGLRAFIIEEGCPKLKRIIGIKDRYYKLTFGKNRIVALKNTFENGHLI